jgi:hypothetical protein
MLRKDLKKTSRLAGGTIDPSENTRFDSPADEWWKPAVAPVWSRNHYRNWVPRCSVLTLLSTAWPPSDMQTGAAHVTLQEIWTALHAIVRAALHAAWAASKVGAIAMATLFTVLNLGIIMHEAAAGHLGIQVLLVVPLGGAALFVLALLFSFPITVPVTFIVTMCAYPFLRRLRGGGRKTYGIAGFLVGSLVWLGLWWSVPQDESLIFGSWISALAIGGLAGCAGGLAFARNLPRRG